MNFLNRNMIIYKTPEEIEIFNEDINRKDLIERLYWERSIQSLQDLNNCINFS